MSEFSIVDISGAVPQADEQMGTKEKFWVEWDGQQRLFKYNRKNYGEDWAEKIAGEVARCLRVPCATSELACFQGESGVLVESFAHQRAAAGGHPRKIAELVHGSDLIALLVDPDYPRELRMKNRDHTLDRVESVLKRFGVSQEQRASAALTDDVATAYDLFLAYLLLDALVSNTDRHHRNWGLLVPLRGVASPRLSPSFDHASSLGRNLSDDQRRQRLTTVDQGFHVRTYALKAPTRLYRDNNDAQPFNAVEAFEAASVRSRRAGRFWLDRLGDGSEQELASIIHRVPDERMSPLAKDFAAAMVSAARHRLLEGAA